MSLFQKSVKKKYLNELDSALVDKKFNDFQSYFGNTEIQENIRNSKEEEFQEGFIRIERKPVICWIISIY